MRTWPFRQYNLNDIDSNFTLNTTGDDGIFAAYGNGAFFGDGFTTIPVGNVFPGADSFVYSPLATIQIAPSGTTASMFAGITLKASLTTDENGDQLRWNKDRLNDLNAVLSGQPMPVMKQGVIAIQNYCFEGYPLPGKVGVISNNGNGKVVALNYADIEASGYSYNQIIGRFMSDAPTMVINQLTGQYSIFEITAGIPGFPYSSGAVTGTFIDLFHIYAT